MNRSVIKYLLVFILLAVLLIFFFKNRMPFGKSNTSFAVDNKVEITRIDFFQEENRLSLEKSDERWLINKKDEARKSAVSFIIRILKEMRIKSPVSGEIFENEIIKKQIKPVRINIYSKRRLVKSFFVYKTGSNIYGNIMKLRATSKPFIVYLPGYEDNIGNHLVINEQFWKPFMVFKLLPSEIESVKFEDMSDTASTFIINCKNRIYTFSDGRRVITGWDTLKVKRYLTYFTAVAFDTWAFDLSEEEKRNIESESPLYRITVKQTDAPEKTLTIWERSGSVYSGNKKDTDKVWAKTNFQDGIFIMRYFDLDPILKKRTYFFSE